MTPPSVDVLPIVRNRASGCSQTRPLCLGVGPKRGSLDEAGHYLRAKRKRLTAASYRDYEGCLDKLARYFADLEISDFEPPIGTERLEEFLDRQWGERAGRTYNKNLSILRDFFKFHVLRGNLHGDPTLPIERAKKRAVLRENFSANTRNPLGFKPDLG